MSGWQRIGVVISVLWLVSVPLYGAMDYNSRVWRRFSDCVNSNRDSAPVTGLRTAEWCGRRNVSMSLTDTFGVIVGREPLPGIGQIEHRWDVSLAMIIWVPLVLFWLVGWIVLGTVRWVRRGFTGPGR